MRYFLTALFVFFIAMPASALDWPKNHTRTLVLDNRCHSALRILVTHSPKPDVWEKSGWFELEPGERIFPVAKGVRLQHRDNATLLIYARALDGSFQLRGDHGTNFNGEHYKSYEVSRLFRGTFAEARVNCG